MSCKNVCGACGCKVSDSDKHLITVLRQIFGELEKIDKDGKIKTSTELLNSEADAQSEKYADLAYGIYNNDARFYSRRAAEFVRIVEKYVAEYPHFGGFVKEFAICMFGVYRHFCNVNAARFVDFPKMDNAYEYTKRLASGADHIFDVDEPCGFGVKLGLGTLDFSDTRFICDEKAGISGMLVKKADGISEKVIIKNHEGTFDYEKAAMMLLLKGLFGGKGKAVEVVRFVETELRNAGIGSSIVGAEKTTQQTIRQVEKSLVDSTENTATNAEPVEENELSTTSEGGDEA